MSLKIVSTGSALIGFSVLAGAFGAHMLQGKIGYDLLEIFKTGNHYLSLHGIGLILFGLMRPSRLWPAFCFLAGIFLFSGSLYAITFTGIRTFGMITPIGGVLFIAGWVGFFLEARKASL